MPCSKCNKPGHYAKTCKSIPTPPVEEPMPPPVEPPPPYNDELIAQENYYNDVLTLVFPRLFSMERGIMYKHLTRQKYDLAYFICLAYHHSPSSFVIYRQPGKHILHTSVLDPRPHIRLHIHTTPTIYRTLHIGLDKLKVTYVELNTNYFGDRFTTSLIKNNA